MGTRSRIIIRRSTKPNIHLWMHWDGYFAGQGDEICRQLASLLSKYSTVALQANMEEMDVLDLTEDKGQNFSAEHLEDFIEGRVNFHNDECNDIEYEYTIDFNNRILLARSIHITAVFPVFMATIQDGFRLSQLNEYVKEWEC